MVNMERILKCQLKKLGLSAKILPDKESKVLEGKDNFSTFLGTPLNAILGFAELFGNTSDFDTKLKLKASDILIDIKDSGIGIQHSMISQLFQPFNRFGPENSAIERTELGLTITKKLVEALGRTIGVSGKLAVGSHFWIVLPINDQK
jgi:K+-sensing histidine kinase KdpD